MFEKEQLEKEVQTLNNKLNSQEVWNDHKLSNELLKKKNNITKFLDSLKKISEKFVDLKELITLAEVESENTLLRDLENELLELYNNINLLYVETLMKGKADSKNCF